MDHVISRKKVCIQGLGFVGAAMSLAVASAKNNEGNALYDVVGIDLPHDEGKRRINSLNEGIFPFESTDAKLMEAMKEAAANGNLRGSTDHVEFEDADYVIVDINLDISYKDGNTYLDLSAFKKAITTLGQRIKQDCLVIVETTVPPGTCQKVVHPIIEEMFKKRGLDPENIRIAHSYERVMPGAEYFDSIVNFWRVYSGIDERSADLCEAFLKTVIRTDKYPLTRLEGTVSTETAKVLENSYRAATIAFMEEWGRFAEAVGFDLFKVIDAIRMRPTHSNMRQPGFGVGGYCLTKDPFFAKLAARDLYGLAGMDFPFSTQAVQFNNRMPLVSLEKIDELLKGLAGKKLLILGISYRQDVGDTRYSPSEIFAREAIRRGAEIDCQDPLVDYWEEMGKPVRKELPSLENYDAVILAVQHKQYLGIRFDKIEKKMLVFDANRVLSDSQISEIRNNKNLCFYSIGRGAI